MGFPARLGRLLPAVRPDVEQRPDTFVTLTTGERLVVGETMDEVMRRAIDYQRSKHLVPPMCMPPMATTGTYDGEES